MDTVIHCNLYDMVYVAGEDSNHRVSSRIDAG